MDSHGATTPRGLVIAAFPKSASSHLVALVEKAVPKSLVVRPKTCKGFGHNLLNPERIPVEPAAHVVAYGHMPACGHNLDVILTKMVRPSCVVAIRSLPDVVVSFADHIQRDRRAPIDFDTPGLVDGFLGTMDLSRSELYNLIIDYTVPWYIRFLCSWLHGRHGIPLTVSTFEEHTGLPAAAIGHLVAFAGLECDPNIVRSFNDERTTGRVNFNQGVTGRGRNELSARQLDRVAELAHGVKGLRGTRIAHYLAGGFPAVDRAPHDVLSQKMRGGTTREWFLEDQPYTDTSVTLNPAAHACPERETYFSPVE